MLNVLCRLVGGIAVECDVSDCKSVERMARQVEAAHGRLDLLVSNACISIEDDASWELHPAEWSSRTILRGWVAAHDPSAGRG